MWDLRASTIENDELQCGIQTDAKLGGVSDTSTKSIVQVITVASKDFCDQVFRPPSEGEYRRAKQSTWPAQG